MADDAGALLVRSGLVPASALDDARARVTQSGGTIGEQLVTAGLLPDEVLTDFYKSRLLVPQVNPNTLARLPAKVVALIPSDMAIELRAIPVSLDQDNNLTIAMGDPSDRHAVDEISFFTGAYVVRAVATQMQIAWCLAHYYGHVTSLGQRLIQPNSPDPQGRPPKRAGRITAEVQAQRKGRIPAGISLQPPTATPAGTAPQPVVDTPSAALRLVRARPMVIRSADLAPEDSGPLIEIVHEPSAPIIELEESDLHAPETPDPEDAEITVEHAPEPPPKPQRRRPAEPDPPELAARGGEIVARSGPVKAQVDAEPAVVVAVELEQESPALASREVTSPLPIVEIPPELAQFAHPSKVLVPTIGRVGSVIDDEVSEPLVIRRREDEPEADAEPEPEREPEEGGDSDVIVLVSPKPARDPAPPKIAPTLAAGRKPQKKARHTQLGIGVVSATTAARDASGIPSEVDDQPTDSRASDNDPTRLDARAVPPGDYTTSNEILAAPPSPVDEEDDATSPIAAPPPGEGRAVPPPSGKVSFENVRPRSGGEEEEDEDTLNPGRATEVMRAVDLEEVLGPDAPATGERRIDYDPVDDGWGPPGTTIPPPLLGAMPGSEGPVSGIIPLPNVDTAPLLVAPPVAPEVSKPELSGQALTRALEDAMARVLDLIRTLEQATSRDEVVTVMVAHLAQSHVRAGFFAVRGGELSMFALSPPPANMAATTLRLDRPSTLQDVVGTRLPYRGPMHDDASRAFLASVLGAAPAEILLVPVTLRERVVGVLFGEQRLRHTFDDQLALAARAAGAALERILKAKRG